MAVWPPCKYWVTPYKSRMKLSNDISESVKYWMTPYPTARSRMRQIRHIYNFQQMPVLVYSSPSPTIPRRISEQFKAQNYANHANFDINSYKVKNCNLWRLFSGFQDIQIQKSHAIFYPQYTFFQWGDITSHFYNDFKWRQMAKMSLQGLIWRILKTIYT